MRERRYLGFAVVVAVAVAVWRGVRVEPVVPPPADGVDAIEAAGAAAPSAAVVAAERTVGAERAGIDGVALAADGTPLAGWSVTLVAQRGTAVPGEPMLPSGLAPMPRTPAAARNRIGYPTWSSVTDASGHFAFESIGPGTYALALDACAHVGVSVELAAGERRTVELRLDTELCVVVLAPTRGARPVEGRVQVRFADGREVWYPVEGGEVRFATRPGPHRMRVTSTAPSPRETSLHGVPLVAEVPFEIHAAPAEQRFRLDVPSPTLEVVVSDGGTAPVPKLAFVVAGTCALTGGPAKYELRSDDGRSARIEDLPPGRWEVQVTSPWFRAGPQTVEVPQATLTHRLVLSGQRTAVVRLDLRTRTGAPLSASVLRHAASAMPPLRSGERSIECSDVAEFLSPRADGRVPGFAGVPLGPATWAVADREVDGVVHFAACDAVPEQRIDVQGGRDVLTVCVEPRAFVELVGCFQSGMQSPTARLRVFAGGRRVAALGDEESSRWQAFLPPGEYRVELETAERSGGAVGTHVQSLFVQRANITRRLRP